MEPLPPYDYETLKGVMMKLDGNRGPIKFDAVVAAWMQSAKDKAKRTSAIDWLVENHWVVLEGRNIILVDREEDEAEEGEGEDAAEKSAAASSSSSSSSSSSIGKEVITTKYDSLPPPLAGKLFMAKLARSEGAYVVRNGNSNDDSVATIVIRALKKCKAAAADTSKSPTPDSECAFHYIGKLVNGKIFDSSIAKGKPLVAKLDQLIAGWRKVLPLMREGDRFECAFPFTLGYGERGSPPDVPGFSTLHFVIELLKVTSGGKPGSDADKLLIEAIGVSGEDM